MKICLKELQKILACILMAGILMLNVIPVTTQAANSNAEKKSAVTEDKVMELSSDSTALNKGDTVEVKFSIHNTETYGFFGYLEYDTDVFGSLEAGALVPSDYVPKEDENQGSWIASYSPKDRSIEVHWRGAKPVKLPDETKGVVLTIKLVVKKSVETTKISLNYPKVYKTNTSTDTISYPSGLAITLKNAKAKKFVLTTKDVETTGNTVAVPVSCSANEGFQSLDLIVTFDKTKLQYQSLSVENAIKNYVSVASYSMDSSGNKVTIRISASQEVKNVGGLFIVYFTPVKPAATSQDTTTITDIVTFSAENVQNESESAVVTTGASSKVTVKYEAALQGDINGNHKIDLVDALYIVQYYNKTRYFTEEQKKAADVNKNGTVDLVDALLIMQYYNGVIKSFP